MTNTKNRKVIVLTLICLVIALGAWMSLNASGFCYTKGRYLEQTEIFQKVVERSLQPESVEMFEEYLKNGANKDLKRLLSSSSYEEFVRLNPNCCSYYFSENRSPKLTEKIRKLESFWNLNDPPIHFRLLGLAWRSILIGSNLRYINSSDMEKSHSLGSVTWINGCGEHVQPPRKYIVG